MARGRGRGASSASARGSAHARRLPSWTTTRNHRPRKGIPAEKPGFEKPCPGRIAPTPRFRPRRIIERQKLLHAGRACCCKGKSRSPQAEVDQAAADDEANTINSLADLPEDDDTVLEFTDTDFQRIKEDTTMSRWGICSKPKSKPAAKAQGPKNQRRGHEGEMEELTRALKAKGVEGSRRGPEQLPPSVLVFPLATLRPWERQSRPGIPRKIRVWRPNRGRPESTHPDLTGAEAVRSNETIQIDLDSDGDNTPIRLPAAVPRKVTASKVKAEPKIPALAVGLDTKTPTNKKKRVKLKQSVGDVNGLLALVGPTWETLALPALYSALYRSLDPMIFATKDLPGEYATDLLVEHVLLSQAVSRVLECWTLVIQTCLSVIDAFFKTEEYLVNPPIMKYAKYALHVDGPHFGRYRHPRAAHAIPRRWSILLYGVSDDDPDRLRVSQERRVDPSHRTGRHSYDASGLPVVYLASLLALEHRFKLYSQTGRREESVPVFKAKTHNTAIRAYVSNIERFTISRWTSLLTALGPTTVITTAPEVIDDELDGRREYAYVASSP
ncbi:hypothetical protein B0H10DRAFT_1966032 [Mycena sp. CBHHK59/15]|nr:hypothetical protein B0H10DRAFT_1966032 [Mycena sp. CBHHK59/15]